MRFFSQSQSFTSAEAFMAPKLLEFRSNWKRFGKESLPSLFSNGLGHIWVYLVRLSSGAFHSTKTSGLNFRQLPLANGTAFCKISKKRTTSRGIPKFSETFSRKFSFHSTLLPGFLEFLVERFAFQKFNSFRNFWKLFRGNFCTICCCFQIFKSFG